MTEDLKLLCHQKQIEKEEIEKKNHKLQVALEQAYQVSTNELLFFLTNVGFF